MNSDAAFQGNYAFVGNYNGVNIYDISNPAAPVLVTSLSCPGSQNDVSVHKNLLFVSVESDNAQARLHCFDPTQRRRRRQTRFRGIRIFDISDIERRRVQVDGVQTCRGSHTHTLLRPKDDPNNVYIYVSGTAGVRTSDGDRGLRRQQRLRRRTPNPSLWRIEVIKVPLAAPSTAAVVGEPRLFADGDRRGRRPAERPADAEAPVRVTSPTAAACVPGHEPDHGGANWSPSPITDACHDITVYEEIDLAAGACEGNGILIDISDPANPKRIDAVADPLFAYWHGATFSNDGKAVLFTDEWGGGTGARCRATDQLSWGADAIYEIVNSKLVFRSYYKLPVAQTVSRELRLARRQPRAGPAARTS